MQIFVRRYSSYNYDAFICCETSNSTFMFGLELGSSRFETGVVVKILTNKFTTRSYSPFVQMMGDFLFWTNNIGAKMYLPQPRTFLLLTALTYHGTRCCYITDPACALCGEHQTALDPPFLAFLEPSAPKDVATITWPGYPTSCI
jgi:hypothetical protein